ncbi:MAG: helix-turn-helix domain-containing protein [Deltaproteobacteria bacterium]|nr:helix-turn-helix domain-containing protein [Deltaproteobacteria bacterium]
MPYCGGPLHRAGYERKPRGGPPDLPEIYSVRLSLCCGREGCRRRTLPPSVLFWGRRVYWAAVVLVLTALRQGRTEGATVRRLQELCGVTRPTLARWLRYFRDAFPQTRAWRALSGRLWPPVSSRALPEVIERFVVQARDGPEAGLVACLFALSTPPR